MSAGSAKSSRVAIVGASTFLGKELAQVLEDRHFPISDLVLLDASVQAGTLTEAAGEPTFIRSLAEDSFDGVNFAFFAGNPLDASQNWPVARRAGATVIDMTGAVAVSGEAVAAAFLRWMRSFPSSQAPPRTVPAILPVVFRRPRR